jgi:hypothetical protein
MDALSYLDCFCKAFCCCVVRCEINRCRAWAAVHTLIKQSMCMEHIFRFLFGFAKNGDQIKGLQI